MDQAWKSINGFIASFTSSFDQIKSVYQVGPVDSSVSFEF